MSDISLENLVGKTIVSIQGLETDLGIFLTCSDGSVYEWYHCDECCDIISLNDILGNISDLIGSPIVKYSKESREVDLLLIETGWSFYNVATDKEFVTVRWYGESSGNYSNKGKFKRVK